MTFDKNSLKIIFALIIFMFSLALAYFSASYLSRENLFDYWGTLIIFTIVYVIVGILVYQVIPVSLGFLFSADILIIHLLLENFGTIPDLLKAGIIGGVLVVLYLVSWSKMKEDQLPPPPVFSPPANQ